MPLAKLQIWITLFVKFLMAGSVVFLAMFYNWFRIRCICSNLTSVEYFMFIGATLQISTYPQLLPDCPPDGIQIEKLLDFAIFPRYLLCLQIIMGKWKIGKQGSQPSTQTNISENWLQSRRCAAPAIKVPMKLSNNIFLPGFIFIFWNWNWLKRICWSKHRDLLKTEASTFLL